MSTGPKKKVISPREILRSAGLVGAYLDRADLRGLDLSNINLSGASLRGADLSNANLSGSILIKADLSRACLYRATFENAWMDAADLNMSYGKATSFKDASMRCCSFRGASYKNSFFWGTDLTGSDFRGFFGLGTAFDDAILYGCVNLHHALFYWYRHKKIPGPPVYEPRRGYFKIGRSYLENMTFQENAGFGRTIHREDFDE